MFARFFNSFAKKTAKDLAKKQIKPTEGFKRNLEWMNKEIEKMDTASNSYTKLDSKEFGSAMKEAEKFEARSFYYR